jgi:hypothetical protein
MRSKIWISYIEGKNNINSEPLTIKFEYDYDYDCYIVSVNKEQKVLKELPFYKSSKNVSFSDIKKSVSVAEKLIKDSEKPNLFKKIIRIIYTRINSWIYNQCGHN